MTLRMVGVADDWGALQERLFPGGASSHAAVMETALGLAGRPALVYQDEVRPPALRDLPGRYRAGGEVFLFDEMTDTGALGDPTPVTAEGAAPPGPR